MLKAIYFDGQTSRRYQVSVALEGDSWHVSGDGIERRDNFNQCQLSEKIGGAPRQLHFPDGAYCLIVDHAALEAMLKGAGYQPHSIVSKWEGKWRYAFVALVLVGLFFAATYQWALPWTANVIAQKLPASIPALMDKQTLATFDGYLFEPSELPPARQQSLAQALAAMQPTEGEILPAYRLVFRKSEVIGPNAFALPGGTVLVTDELVKLADESPHADAQVIGVLVHELGHVQHQHALRNFVQGSIVAAVVTWYLGDVSSLLAAAPIALLNTRYTRDFEREADQYAAGTMLKNGMSPAHLADMLESMQKFALEGHQPEGTETDTEESDKKALNKTTTDPREVDWADYFSTHPNTEERIAKLRAWPREEKAP
ncbi:MAG: M48 family metallopeptidase [Nitrosomonadales bacterium]|nr:M48 family metallopeptidase [Nitrosomonadales bacterium]